MKKIITILTVVFTVVTFAQQQKQTNEKKFWDDVRFGGGLGLNFGNNATSISVSPTAVYDFNEKFSLGTGVGYQYSSFRDVKSNIFSLSALALYNPIQSIQLSTEFEQYFANQKFNGETHNRNIPALYLGVAYTMGRNISLGIRYDVLYDKNDSLFSSAITPIVRVFF